MGRRNAGMPVRANRDSAVLECIERMAADGSAGDEGLTAFAAAYERLSRRAAQQSMTGSARLFARTAEQARVARDFVREDLEAAAQARGATPRTPSPEARRSRPAEPGQAARRIVEDLAEAMAAARRGALRVPCPFRFDPPAGKLLRQS